MLKIENRGHLNSSCVDLLFESPYVDIYEVEVNALTMGEARGCEWHFWYDCDEDDTSTIAPDHFGYEDRLILDPTRHSTALLIHVKGAYRTRVRTIYGETP